MGGGAAEAGVFGLLGLLIAFTFSGAASRFEDRRHLITAEANAIGTAYLRIDLLPGDAQPAMRELFRRYTDARSTTYRNAAEQLATGVMRAEWLPLQAEIWTKAWTACRQPEAPARATMDIEFPRLGLIRVDAADQVLIDLRKSME